MKFYEVGNKYNQKILLIHGMTTTWKMSFQSIIDELEKHYYVIMVALDGHNPDENSSFHSFVEEAINIEQYVVKMHYGKVDAVFGSSLGGTIALQMLADKKIEIGMVLLDGTYASNYGIFAKLISNIMTSLLFKLTSTKSSFVYRLMGLKENGEDIIKNIIYIDISKESVRNCFIESYRYKVPENLIDTKTEVVFWYGSKEKYPPKFAKKIRKVLPDMKVRVLQNYGHGEYALKCPEKIIQEFNDKSDKCEILK